MEASLQTGGNHIGSNQWCLPAGVCLLVAHRPAVHPMSGCMFARFMDQ